MSPVSAITDAVVNIVEAAFSALYAVLDTVYHILSFGLKSIWTVIAGVLRTTFNVSESVIEGIFTTIVGLLEFVWTNKLFIGLALLVAVIYLGRTQPKVVGSGRKVKRN